MSDRRDSRETVEVKRLAGGWILAIVLLAVYMFFQAIPLLSARGGHANDFKHIYLGSIFLWDNGNPYSTDLMITTAGDFRTTDARFGDPESDSIKILPYVYLPFTGLVLGPLSALPFALAVIVFQTLNHLLLIAGIVLAAWAAGWRWRWKDMTLIAAALIFNWTILRQNSAGQLNMVLLFGYALLFAGLMKRWPTIILGFIAAFLMFFKITPGILLFYFIFSRRYWATFWMIAWSAVLFIISLIVFGLNVHLEFLTVLGDMGYGKSTWAELGHTFWRDPYNQSMNSFLHHLFVPWEGFRPLISLSPAAANALTWLFSITIIGLLTWRLRAMTDPAPENDKTEQSDDETRIGYSIAILASLLIPSIMWDHYLVQALIPALLLWKSASLRNPKLSRALIVACVVVISLGVEFSAGFMHFGIIEGFLGNFIAGDLRIGTLPFPKVPPLGQIFMSLKLWPVILLFALGIWLSLKTPPTPEHQS